MCSTTHIRGPIMKPTVVNSSPVLAPHIEQGLAFLGLGLAQSHIALTSVKMYRRREGVEHTGSHSPHHIMGGALGTVEERSL